jgi:hypothetical protein
VTGGVSIQSGGMYVTDGVTVYTGGLYASGGLTVQDNGLNIIAGGMTILANGLVVTGGMSIDEGGLIVTGGMTVYGNTWYQYNPTVASDARLKTDIEPLEDSLAKVSKLRGVYYSWIQDEASGLTFDTDRHVGVLAQDVQAVLPEIVASAYGGRYLGVKYPELIPLLVEAIRELDARTQNVTQTIPPDRPVATYVGATNAADGGGESNVPVSQSTVSRGRGEGGGCGDISAMIAGLSRRLTALENGNTKLHERLKEHESSEGA